MHKTQVESKIQRFHQTFEQTGPRCELAVLHHLEAWEQLLTHLSFRGLSFRLGYLTSSGVHGAFHALSQIPKEMTRNSCHRRRREQILAEDRQSLNPLRS